MGVARGVHAVRPSPLGRPSSSSSTSSSTPRSRSSPRSRTDWACAWVRARTARLLQIAPSVVAITGSYGKTSTKHHLAELLVGHHDRSCRHRGASTTARGSPRRSTSTSSTGRRSSSPRWAPTGAARSARCARGAVPDVAVLTAIGPVHLERFGTIERIVAAKAEITEHARVVVCNVDDERLARAGRAAARGRAATSSRRARPRRRRRAGRGRSPSAGASSCTATRSPSRARSPGSSRRTSPAPSPPASRSASTPTRWRRGSSASLRCPTG